MPNINEEKREVLAYIDAIHTMIEKFPTLNLSGLLENIGIGISLNPWDFLLDIISKYASDEEMMDWLVNVMTELLPVIELGIKGVLLTNLKSLIDCNLDPRIPYWVRKDRTNGGNGFVFNLSSIDYTNMLSYSPLSENGQHKYFGTKRYYTFDKGSYKDKKFYSYKEAVQALDKLRSDDSDSEETITVENIVRKGDISNVYELARANDFNAFLWFVKNKTKIVKAHEIDLDDARDYVTSDEQYPFIDNNFGNILHSLTATIEISGTDALELTQGMTIRQKIRGSYVNTISLCISDNVIEDEDADDFIDYGQVSVFDENACSIASPKKHILTFVPLSDTDNSANWYVNSGTYFNFLLPENKRIARDYDKDFAICNIENISASDAIAQDGNLPSHGQYIRFSVLPAPFVHLPKFEVKTEGEGLNAELQVSGEPFWRMKRILFDVNGESDAKGNYSVTPYEYYDYQYTLRYAYTNSKSHVKLIIDKNDGQYHLECEDGYEYEIPLVLYECYKGLTVYDFNYNYVMGMQLFDPVVVASNLLDMVTNLSKGSGGIHIGVSLDKTELAYQMRVAEILKNVIETSGYESSDCFYTFSNDKFNDMLEKAELKRSQGYEFNGSSLDSTSVNIDGAYDTLNGFDDNATLVENKETLKMAIVQATANITEEVRPEDAYNLKLKIIQELIKGLTLTIVQAVLTPKIILLFEVNKRMMGSDGTVLSFEEFLDSISTLLVTIVRQIADMILRELLRWAKLIVAGLIAKLAELLITEKVEYYARLMVQLIKACSFRVQRSQPLDSTLDNVDYADIDVIDAPQTNEC